MLALVDHFNLDASVEDHIYGMMKAKFPVNVSKDYEKTREGPPKLAQYLKALEQEVRYARRETHYPNAV